MNKKNDKKYEWIGDAESSVDAPENEHSKRYYEPNRYYDDDYKPTKDDIKTFPDLQNGPSSLIQGSPVSIQQVGIHNFRLPLKYDKREGGHIELETKVTGTVSLAAHKKGINMSRIMTSFYEFKNEYVFDKLDVILSKYRDDLNSFDSKILLKFSYPMMKQSLRSGLEGYQYYESALEGHLNGNGKFKKILHFDFVYSSACPCSYKLAEFARNDRNKATVTHSQRSVARISIEFDEIVWIEDLQAMCEEALHTETQVIVKREDEMAFAELNGSYLKFVVQFPGLAYSLLQTWILTLHNLF